MSKIVLALGSNLGDKIFNIRRACNILDIYDIKISRFYLTRSVGEDGELAFDSDNHFINVVISADTLYHCPFDFLRHIKEVEKTMGRDLSLVCAPRPIDIDILFWDELILETEDLIIPHKMLRYRDFVLLPMCDLIPEYIHVKFNRSIVILYHNLVNSNCTRAVIDLV